MPSSTSNQFTPQKLSSTSEEELAYRRGFDQGFAALAQALGLKGPTLQDLAWKHRIHEFRYGRLDDVPFTPTDLEKQEVKLVARRILGYGAW